ncbi:MAG TPA: RnfH family protein [Pseudomonadales bacterium]|nr:RnfH family protein [Pseudomonadales bacterium]
MPLIKIEIACALPDKQWVKALEVASGCTAQQAVALSGIAEVFPGLALAECKLGVFSKVVDSQYVLVDGDRVEVYRPLLLDPKEARRQRAQKSRL